nr:hypothetical protein [Chionoecetes opilio bacilliform virus]
MGGEKVIYLKTTHDGEKTEKTESHSRSGEKCKKDIEQHGRFEGGAAEDVWEHAVHDSQECFKKTISACLSRAATDNLCRNKRRNITRRSHIK